MVTTDKIISFTPATGTPQRVRISSNRGDGADRTYSLPIVGWAICQTRRGMTHVQPVVYHQGWCVTVEQWAIAGLEDTLCPYEILPQTDRE
ncbi:hypothetical protein [Micromonospora sp. NPDC005652]|uniref:hypothetical protein n=1 Tax=Micromonospora sp. NPDC005652 TaxID=3157046 RepID=UPI0033CF6D1D